MNEEKHKFDEVRDPITYREYLTAVYEPLVSFIRHLEGVLGKEQTHEIVSEYSLQQTTEFQTKRFQSLEKPITTIEDVRTWFRNSSAKKSVQMTQTKEELSCTPDSYCFDVQECLWASVLRDLDAGDLGYLLECNTDFVYAKAMHPDLTLERSKTLKQGDDRCDFEFRFKRT